MFTYYPATGIMQCTSSGKRGMLFTVDTALLEITVYIRIREVLSGRKTSKLNLFFGGKQSICGEKFSSNPELFPQTDVTSEKVMAKRSLEANKSGVF